MASVCFYFQVHQPRRVRRYRVFDIGNNHDYWSDASGTSLDNRFIIEKVSTKSYLPANKVLLELLNRYPEFRVSFSLSGIFLEQLEEYAPETLTSFQDLAATGHVEFLSETFYHSLSFLYSIDEFIRQVAHHRRKIKKLFGQTPTVFRNTELIYNNDLARMVAGMGYKGILAEGADHILGWRSPNFLYNPRGAAHIKLLLKNYRLSDDIAFRFSEKSWAEHPLTAPKFAEWVSAVNGNGNVVNLFMDYETFGEHQWEDTGIFNFLRALPGEILKHPDNDFVLPSEAVDRYDSFGELDYPHFVSWADVERDLSAWRSNPMQHDALRAVYELEEPVIAANDSRLLEDWRRLTTSDHFYYMCTKWWSDGDVHAYFNPYESPYDAFISYMNVLKDMGLRLKA
ncbi:glycoside hydrolase family 57 protein [bacterium]|nr:glycoside hydrolase family 57 protein [bacterium]